MTVRVTPGASRASPAATARTAPMKPVGGDEFWQQEAAGAGPKGFKQVLLVT